MVTKEERSVLRNMRKEVQNYYHSVLGSLCLYKYFDEELQYDFYFGGKIERFTPDYIIKNNTKFIIGDLKKSFSDISEIDISEIDEGKESNQKIQEWKKKNSETVEQFENYVDIENSDDVFMISKHIYKRRMKLFSKICLTEKLKDNLSILDFSISDGANTRIIQIDEVLNNFEDEKIKEKIEFGIKYYSGDIQDLEKKYKIIETEKSEVPIEYIMAILWMDIFPEVNNESKGENIMKRKSNKESVFTCNLDDILAITDKFTLPYFGEQEEKNQFNEGVIREAMEKFCDFEVVEVNNGEYTIRWKDLNFDEDRGDLITNFMKRLRKEKIDTMVEREKHETLDDF